MKAPVRVTVTGAAGQSFGVIEASELRFGDIGATIQTRIQGFEERGHAVPHDQPVSM